MKKNLFITICIFSLFVFCTHKNQESDAFLIRLWNANKTIDDRNNADYVQLWINDSLLFNGTYFINFLDDPALDEEFHVGMQNIEDFRGMKLGYINKKNYPDSIKIRIRLIAIDDTLFWGNRRVMDTVFNHRIDNIPELAISMIARGRFFQVEDSINTPMYWYYEY